MQQTTMRTGVLLICVIAAVLGHQYQSKFDELNYRGAIVSLDNGVTMDASPAFLPTSGQWVTVTFSGIDHPTSDDWVGAYAQTPYNISSTPSKFQMCTRDNSYLKTGAGSLRFNLVNMRSNYTFVLFQSTKSPVVIAKSNEVAFANVNEPLQGHIAVTGKNDEMRVMWNTRDADTPTVRYGLASGQYEWSTPAKSSTYKESDMCGGAATSNGWMDPGLMHTAVLTGLNASTKYFYVYGDSFGWSEEQVFVSSPVVGPDGAFNMIAYGDMGKAELDGSEEHWEEVPSLNTTNLVIHNELPTTDIVLHIGDISYAVGYSSQWDEFLEQIKPISSRVPYMTCIGNHERDFPNSHALFSGTDSGGECGVPYENRFPTTNGIRDQPWYSFDYGAAHVVLMSTEHDFVPGSVQYKWIQDDLAAVNRSVTPWIIFAGHRPMYIDSTNWAVPDGDQTVALAMRRAVEPLLMKFKVDLCLWGHHHSYQRTCPVYQEDCVKPNPDKSNNAPVHVVIGMAGQGLSQNLLPIKPKHFEYVNDHEYGYTRIEVTRHTLHMKYMSDIDGGVRDDFVLTKA